MTMSDLPRADLIRMVSLPTAHVEFREDSDDGRLLVGYPIVFNRWTEINGWEGNFLERVHPGALNRTLERRGEQVKVLFNHGFDPSIGDKPLGKPQLMEPRADGLYTETPLARTSYNEDLIELLRSGALDGMSFRFSVKDEEVVKKPERSEANPNGIPERTIRELELYEFGPVTFPAYEATTVGVRAREAFQIWRTAKQTPAEPEARQEAPSDEAPDGPQEAPVGLTRSDRLAVARRKTPLLKEMC